MWDIGFSFYPATGSGAFQIQKHSDVKPEDQQPLVALIIFGVTAVHADTVDEKQTAVRLGPRDGQTRMAKAEAPLSERGLPSCEKNV